MIPIKKLTATATIPKRGSEFAAGLDLYYDAGVNDHWDTVRIRPGKRLLVPTGISMAIPEGYYGQIAPRSGLAVRCGIEVLAGIIDSDYRGEIRVLLKNGDLGEFEFDHGDRIAQMLILPVSNWNPKEVENLPDTTRGEGGFGSTGS